MVRRGESRYFVLAFVALLTAASIGTSAPRSVINIDLRQVNAFAPKGRVQDKEYNGQPVVDQLIDLGPPAIPFLVSKLDDRTPLPHQVFDYWGEPRVGDVALVILTDFFLTADWTHSTIPAMAWETLLEGEDAQLDSYSLFTRFLARHGRRGLRRKVERVLQPYAGDFAWDAHERCFRPGH
jgi:hypothetical protein